MTATAQGKPIGRWRPKVFTGITAALIATLLHPAMESTESIAQTFVWEETRYSHADDFFQGSQTYGEASVTHHSIVGSGNTATLSIPAISLRIKKGLPAGEWGLETENIFQTSKVVDQLREKLKSTYSTYGRPTVAGITVTDSGGAVSRQNGYVFSGAQESYFFFWDEIGMTHAYGNPSDIHLGYANLVSYTGVYSSNFAILGGGIWAPTTTVWYGDLRDPYTGNSIASPELEEITPVLMPTLNDAGAGAQKIYSYPTKNTVSPGGIPVGALWLNPQAGNDPANYVPLTQTTVLPETILTNSLRSRGRDDTEISAKLTLNDFSDPDLLYDIPQYWNDYSRVQASGSYGYGTWNLGNGAVAVSLLSTLQTTVSYSDIPDHHRIVAPDPITGYFDWTQSEELSHVIHATNLTIQTGSHALSLSPDYHPSSLGGAIDGYTDTQSAHEIWITATDSHGAGISGDGKIANYARLRFRGTADSLFTIGENVLIDNLSFGAGQMFSETGGTLKVHGEIRGQGGTKVIGFDHLVLSGSKAHFEGIMVEDVERVDVADGAYLSSSILNTAVDVRVGEGGRVSFLPRSSDNPAFAVVGLEVQADGHVYVGASDLSVESLDIQQGGVLLLDAWTTRELGFSSGLQLKGGNRGSQLRDLISSGRVIAGTSAATDSQVPRVFPVYRPADDSTHVCLYEPRMWLLYGEIQLSEDLVAEDFLGVEGDGVLNANGHSVSADRITLQGRPGGQSPLSSAGRIVTDSLELYGGASVTLPASSQVTAASVGDGCTLRLMGGGAANVHVFSGGTMLLNAGSTLTGTLSISNGGLVDGCNKPLSVGNLYVAGGAALLKDVGSLTAGNVRVESGGNIAMTGDFNITDDLIIHGGLSAGGGRVSANYIRLGLGLNSAIAGAASMSAAKLDVYSPGQLVLGGSSTIGSAFIAAGASLATSGNGVALGSMQVQGGGVVFNGNTTLTGTLSASGASSRINAMSQNLSAQDIALANGASLVNPRHLSTQWLDVYGLASVEAGGDIVVAKDLSMWSGGVVAANGNGIQARNAYLSGTSAITDAGPISITDSLWLSSNASIQAAGASIVATYVNLSGRARLTNVHALVSSTVSLSGSSCIDGPTNITTNRLVLRQSSTATLGVDAAVAVAQLFSSARLITSGSGNITQSLDNDFSTVVLGAELRLQGAYTGWSGALDGGGYGIHANSISLNSSTVINTLALTASSGVELSRDSYLQTDGPLTAAWMSISESDASFAGGIVLSDYMTVTGMSHVDAGGGALEANTLAVVQGATVTGVGRLAVNSLRVAGDALIDISESGMVHGRLTIEDGAMFGTTGQILSSGTITLDSNGILDVGGLNSTRVELTGSSSLYLSGEMVVTGVLDVRGGGWIEAATNTVTAGSISLSGSDALLHEGKLVAGSVRLENGAALRLNPDSRLGSVRIFANTAVETASIANISESLVVSEGSVTLGADLTLTDGFSLVDGRVDAGGRDVSAAWIDVWSSGKNQAWSLENLGRITTPFLTIAGGSVTLNGGNVDSLNTYDALVDLRLDQTSSFNVDSTLVVSGLAVSPGGRLQLRSFEEDLPIGRVGFRWLGGNHIAQLTEYIADGRLGYRSGLGNVAAVYDLESDSTLVIDPFVRRTFDVDDVFQPQDSGPAPIIGNTEIRKSGVGTLILSASNSHYAGTVLEEGSLVVGDEYALGVGHVRVTSGVLDLSSFSIANPLTITGGTLLNAANYAGMITVGGTVALTGTVGGIVAVEGELRGSDAVFDGPVEMMFGAVHSPGNSPGQQTFSGGLFYSGFATLNWELVGNTTSGEGVSFDFLSVDGGDLWIADGASVNLLFSGSGSTVDWSDLFWETDQSWTIIDATGADWSEGEFALGEIGTDSNNLALATVRPMAGFSVNRDGANIVLNYSAVPEPATYAMALAGLACGGFSMWRRRKRT